MPFWEENPMHRFRLAATVTASVAGVAVLALAAGCGGSKTGGGEAAAPATPVVNQELRLTLDPPAGAGFAVQANEGATLVLVRSVGESGESATLTFEAGEPEPNVNLVDAVNRQKAAIESRPEGHFLGQVQLMSQLGTAFSTRGRYPGDDGKEIEELRLFAIHPDGDRLLSLIYRYPTDSGATKDRINEAMGALGLVKPLEAEPAAASPSGGS